VTVLRARTARRRKGEECLRMRASYSGAILSRNLIL
jgi:hypothetical protein